MVCWKEEGEGKEIHVMINPTSMEIEELMTKPLIGFNNRKYDNHILWARLMGYTNEQLFNLSKAIINDKQRNNLFQEAYKVSKTDIYDFSAKKQSLKKFEIDLGIHHQELGFDWDKPVPEDKRDLVVEYCKNDVIATEAVWNKRHSDYVAREILADVADMTVNDTTNQLTTRIIFGKNRKPQSEFNYRDLNENMKNYGGKTMKIKGRAVTGQDIPEGKFVFGRHVMTCCVQDIQFAGMVCKYPSTIKRPENGQWVKITGKVKIETDPIYGDGLPGPVVYCTKVTAVNPADPEVAQF